MSSTNYCQMLLLCTGLLLDLSEEYKAKWSCPRCRSKLPKSDNTNTPARALNQQLVEQDERLLNVNSRRGGQTDKSSTADVQLESVRLIVREELESVLLSFKNHLLHQFDEKIKDLLNSFKRVSDSVSDIEKQQDIIKSDLETTSSKIGQLESENTSLRSTVTELTSRIARMEQHSRACNIEIQNIPEHKSENLVTIAKQIANITNYKLNESDIHVCTRVAKINNDTQRPRSVIIKLSSPRVRDEFLAAALRFNKKANSVTDKLNTTHIGISGAKKPVFVVEHLSPTQKAIHAAARIKAKELSYKFVWVKGGRIFMRKTDTSEYKLIKSIQELSHLN
ncbi:uncharacterized protein [Epargyreus clarus]|uniref:uncharacterized protein n=1 Tax=Epargyreus clarus TaxID=520877 RepID=UPI003C2BAD8C